MKKYFNFLNTQLNLTFYMNFNLNLIIFSLKSQYNRICHNTPKREIGREMKNDSCFFCLVYHERNSILYPILLTLFNHCLLILKAINNHPNPNRSTNVLSKEPYTNYSFIFINLTSRRREKLKFIWFFYHDFFCYFLYCILLYFIVFYDSG